MNFAALLVIALSAAVNVACAAAVVRALGLRRMACGPPRDPPVWEPLHWVPTRRVGQVSRAMVERGFLVLNVGSTDGMMLLAIREGRVGKVVM